MLCDNPATIGAALPVEETRQRVCTAASRSSDDGQQPNAPPRRSVDYDSRLATTKSRKKDQHRPCCLMLIKALPSVGSVFVTVTPSGQIPPREEKEPTRERFASTKPGSDRGARRSQDAPGRRGP